MIALCLFMTDGSRREQDKALELAYSSYIRSGNVRHALCSYLWWIELLKARGDYFGAADGLIRCAHDQKDSDGDLRAALLTEQSALCFVQLQPSHFRKYSLHLVLAGHRYYKAGQRHHAVRCYASALTCYEGKKWSHIEDHIHATLAKQSVHLGRFETAVLYYLHLLGNNSHKSVERQSNHLRDFVGVVKAVYGGNEPEIAELPVPVFKDSTLSMRTLNDQTSPAVDGLAKRQMWELLEAALLEAVAAAIGPGVTEERSHSRHRPLAHRKGRVSGVDETVNVMLEISNPLGVAVELTDITLICKHSKQTPAEFTAPTRPSPIVHASLPDPYAEETAAAVDEACQVFAESKTLEPNESVQLALRMKANEPGMVFISGVRWKLLNSVPGSHLFHRLKPPPRPMIDRTDDVTDEHYEPQPLVEHQTKQDEQIDFSLLLNVVGLLPLASIRLHNLPATMLHGEVCKVVMEVANVGRTSLHKLWMHSNLPAFFSFSDPSALDTPFPIFTDQRQASVAEMDGPAQAILDVPVGVVPEDGVVLVPLWVRAHTPGHHSIHFVFSYLPEGKHDTTHLRFLRVTVPSLHVAPLLITRTFVRPSTSSVEEYIVGLEIEGSPQTNEPCHMHQLSALSPFWCIRPLGTAEQLHEAYAGASLLVQSNSRHIVYSPLPSHV
jgi:hypothetical protein